MTIPNVKDVRRGEEIGYFPLLQSCYLSHGVGGGGEGGGGHFTQALGFLLALTEEMTTIRSHSSPLEKSGHTHGLKFNFFKNFQAVNH